MMMMMLMLILMPMLILGFEVDSLLDFYFNADVLMKRFYKGSDDDKGSSDDDDKGSGKGKDNGSGSSGSQPASQPAS
jgi:hypothetical protein